MGGDTVVFPTIQMAPHGIINDEQVTSELLDAIGKELDSHLVFTTPYFNITSSLEQRLVQSKGKVTVLTGAPKANGFYGSAGLSSIIPSLYVHSEAQFFNRIKQRNLEEQVMFFATVFVIFFIDITVRSVSSRMDVSCQRHLV